MGSYAPSTQSASLSEAASAALNRFLSSAARAGNISAEHVRAGYRQPQSEAFVRKIVRAMLRFSDAIKASASVREIPSSEGANGPAALARSAKEKLLSTPELKRYLSEPNPAQSCVDPEISDLDLHCLLSTYAMNEPHGGLSMPARTQAVSMAAQIGRKELSGSIVSAADSVLSQSMADVYAISLRAAHDGNSAALRALAAVRESRGASGDYTSMSDAPLSHDTNAALAVLRQQLVSGKKFWQMSTRDLRDNSRWVAAEGLSSWLLDHGIDREVASDLSAQASVLHRFPDLAQNHPAAAPVRKASLSA